MATPREVLIVGGGIMGAVVARRLSDLAPSLHVRVIDAGRPIGDRPGIHLHEVADPELWRRYNAAAAAGLQPSYVGASVGVGLAADGLPLEGMQPLGMFGHDIAELPGAAVGWNAGGMGVHWSAATPDPFGAEIPSFVDPDEWAADLAVAQQLLHVDPHPFPGRAEIDTIRDALCRAFADDCAGGRPVTDMPMAIDVEESGRLVRVGPAAIMGATGQGRITLETGTLCERVVMEGGRVSGAVLREQRSGMSRFVAVDIVVVCADAIRTPQLLWASGLRGAVGARLNEHAFLTAQAIVDLEELGIRAEDIAPPHEGETALGSLWLPYNDARQPFQGQMFVNPVLAEDLRTVLGVVVQLSWYVPLLDSDGRLDFDDAALDAVGMPRVTAHWSLADEDAKRIEAGRVSMHRAATAVGRLRADPVLLPAGSSLHYTGTVRMGASDDGDSVCDASGRVWGVDGLYVAGNGVIPTALAVNSTLTGTVTAVRVARAVHQTSVG